MRSTNSYKNVSMGNILSYLEFMNKGKPFDSSEQAHQFREQKVILDDSSTIKKSKVNEKQISAQEQELHLEERRQFNQNRAIKRILSTCQDILEKNYEFKPEEVEEEKSGKANETQLNIYLKQYNRLIEKITNDEKKKTDYYENAYDEKEEVLQNIFDFAVKEDFREIVSTAIVKEKISKQNIDRMVTAFQNSLIILKTNDLILHESEDPDSPSRKIKLYEIENVDYHTQPHIMIVLTIIKQKSMTSQFLYLKFNSLSNQDKWDRALYCNFISKEMKKKRKLFQLDFPEDELNTRAQNEPIELKKKSQYAYEVDRDQVLKKIAYDLDAITENESTVSNPKKRGLTTNQIEFSEPEFKADRSKTVNNKVSAEEQELEDQTKTSGLKLIGSILSRLATPKESQGKGKPNVTYEQNPSEIKDSRKDISEKAESELKEQIDRTDSRIVSEPKIGVEKHDLDSSIVHNSSLKKVQNEGTQNIDGNSFQLNLRRIDDDQAQSRMIHQAPGRQSPDTKRLRDLQKTNILGVILTKEKMFFNKSKIFYFKLVTQDKSKKQVYILEYWDINTDSRDKTERKTIPVSSIQDIAIKEQKLIITYANNKEMVLVGSENKMKEIVEWVQLVNRKQHAVQEEKIEKKSEKIPSKVKHSASLQPQFINPFNSPTNTRRDHNSIVEEVKDDSSKKNQGVTPNIFESLLK